MIGFKGRATLLSLEDQEIQKIRCNSSSKHILTANFQGGGQNSLVQTLEIITENKLSPQVKPFATKCIYNGSTYLIVAMQSHNSRTIQNQFVKPRMRTIISLQ